MDSEGTPHPPKTPGTSARQVRPPYGNRMPLPGVSDPSSIRRTAQVRPKVRPVVVDGRADDFSMTDRYVRRFWVAAIGPGAVADLLRLAAAAHSGRSLPLPTHVPTLLVHGLVVRVGNTLGVRRTVPPLPRHVRSSLPPSLRGELIALDRRAA